MDSRSPFAVRIAGDQPQCSGDFTKPMGLFTGATTFWRRQMALRPSSYHPAYRRSAGGYGHRP